MSLVAVLPVKRFPSAKVRLANGGLSSAQRLALATGMLSDVLAALRRCSLVDDIVVVTSEPGAEALARGAGAQVVTDDPNEGHSDAAQRGIDWAVADGAFHTLLIAGDVPALDPAEIDSLIKSLADDTEVVIVPDRHGSGTNALILTPADVISPSFGEGSCERHQQLATDAGVQARVESSFGLGLDVDTADDLEALTAALEGAEPSVAPFTRAVIGRLGAR
ncbi:MAG: 2-phospho-L-lactate guanylyltransferase [Actinomycetes bacterium]